MYDMCTKLINLGLVGFTNKHEIYENRVFQKEFLSMLSNQGKEYRELEIMRT